MTGNEKIKAAFMTLLADFKADIDDYSEFGYCYTSCPFKRAYRNGGICPRHDVDCSEAIFNWYLENAHD